MKTFCLLMLSSFLLSQPTGRQVMELVNNKIGPKDVASTTSMTLTKIVGGKERRRISVIARLQKFYETGDFLSKTLIRFKEPEDVKGTSLLMWKHRADDKESEQWLYLPALNKSKRIFSKQKTTNFMSSDFSYEDMEGREIDDDTYRILGKEKFIDNKCYKIEARPVKSSSYSRRILWVDEEESLIRKIEFYDKKNQLLKIMTIPKIRKDGDYWTVLKMEMENIQKSHRTTVEVSNISYDTKMEDSFFTEKYLKKTQ